MFSMVVMDKVRSGRASEKGMIHYKKRQLQRLNCIQSFKLEFGDEPKILDRI